MKRKRFKKQKDLIRFAVKNIERLTEDEKLAKNILILGGIRNPSLGLIREAMKKVVRKAVNNE